MLPVNLGAPDIQASPAVKGNCCQAPRLAPPCRRAGESNHSCAGPEAACIPPPPLAVPLTIGLATSHVELHVTDDSGNMLPLEGCPELFLAKMRDVKVQPSFLLGFGDLCDGLFAPSGRQAESDHLDATHQGFMTISFESHEWLMIKSGTLPGFLWE